MSTLTRSRSVLACIAVAGCIGIANRPFALESHAASETAVTASKPSTGTNVILIGLSSVLEYPQSLLEDSALFCARFVIRSFTGTVKRLRLTTSGIGGARLAELSAIEKRGGCSNTDLSRALDTLTFSDVKDSGRVIELIIPKEAFPDTSSGSKGKLIWLADDNPAKEFPVVLQRESYSSRVKALLWFIGIFLPVLLTAVIGLLVYRIQKRGDVSITEKGDFQKFKNERAGELKKFFGGGLYKNIRLTEDADDYRRMMERELANLNIFSFLPSDSREQLLGFLRKGEREKVDKKLAAAFPEYRKEIESSSH